MTHFAILTSFLSFLAPQDAAPTRRAEEPRAPRTVAEALDALHATKMRWFAAGLLRTTPPESSDPGPSTFLADRTLELPPEVLKRIASRGGEEAPDVPMGEVLRHHLAKQAWNLSRSLENFDPEALMERFAGAGDRTEEPWTEPDWYSEPDSQLRSWSPPDRGLPYLLWALLRETEAYWLDRDLSRHDFLGRLLVMGAESPARAQCVVLAITPPLTFEVTEHLSGDEETIPVWMRGMPDLEGRVGFTADHRRIALRLLEQAMEKLATEPYGWQQMYAHALMAAVGREVDVSTWDGSIDLTDPKSIGMMFYNWASNGLPPAELQARARHLALALARGEGVVPGLAERLAELERAFAEGKIPEADFRRQRDSLLDEPLFAAAEALGAAARYAIGQAEPHAALDWLEGLTAELSGQGADRLAEVSLRSAFARVFEGNPEVALSVVQDGLSENRTRSDFALDRAIDALLDPSNYGDPTVDPARTRAADLLAGLSASDPDVRRRVLFSSDVLDAPQAYRVFDAEMSYLEAPGNRDPFRISSVVLGLKNRLESHPAERAEVETHLARLFEAGVWGNPHDAALGDADRAWAIRALGPRAEALAAAGKLPAWARELLQDGQ